MSFKRIVLALRFMNDGKRKRKILFYKNEEEERGNKMLSRIECSGKVNEYYYYTDKEISATKSQPNNKKRKKNNIQPTFIYIHSMIAINVYVLTARIIFFLF